MGNELFQVIVNAHHKLELCENSSELNLMF